eukprot:CAMPEP_0170649244 /NCGR_PEP_ID=MMETSP0224-20130122/45182_1 /TAXON_ID=285029 /ORGANISM="Togula jolla, Strain CCCM 725" /LENGTH=44 /DNA_ID= /DNA_START= /DNA_END= /DNA_ORIENTATION=
MRRAILKASQLATFAGCAMAERSPAANACLECSRICDPPNGNAW